MTILAALVVLLDADGLLHLIEAVCLMNDQTESDGQVVSRLTSESDVVETDVFSLTCFPLLVI